MTFLYPAFLFALAVAAIPIILHLVQLRRAKKVIFSNVRFIQASQEVTASQRKLKNLLILLCRILFIIFLVLAFAQPFIPGNVSHQAASNDVAIVVDNSYSMQNQHEEQDLSLLQYATDKARSVLELFPAGAVYTVSENGDYARTRYSSTVEAADRLNRFDFTAVSNTNYKQGQDGHIFVFSDFQKNQFNPSVLAAAPANAQVHLVPLAAAATANLFIDTVYLEDAFVRAGADAVLHVDLYNTGNETAEDVPLKLIINQQQIAALSLDLAPQQKSVATIKFKVAEAQQYNAAVLIEDYPVEFDNSYYFTLTPSKGIKIVEVTDGKSIDLQNLYSKEPLFKYSKFSAGGVDYSRVNDADVLILNGIKEINAGLSTTVSNFIKEGCTVVLIPAASTDVQGYDNFFRQVTIGARLVNATTKTELLPPAPDNPFFSGIFADYDKKMQMPVAARSLQWSRASDDILKFRGGAGFLSRFERGKGQVYVMAAALHEEQTSFVNHALLLPVMYKIAITGYKQEQPLAHTLNAGTIRMPVVQTIAGEGIYKLQKDSATYIPEQQIRGGNLFFNVPPDLREAGIYTLTLQDKPVSNIAFNYDNRESYLEQYTPEELRSMISSDLGNVHVYDYGDAFSVKKEFEKRYFGVKLWKYCLILCLIFLMAEIALIRFL